MEHMIIKDTGNSPVRVTYTLCGTLQTLIRKELENFKDRFEDDAEFKSALIKLFKKSRFDNGSLEIQLIRGNGIAQIKCCAWDTHECICITIVELPDTAAVHPVRPKASSVAKPCVVITHSFDPATTVYEYDTEAEAEGAFHRLYNKYLLEEVHEGSALNESECWCDDTYGRITWEDGCMTEFALTVISKEA